MTNFNVTILFAQINAVINCDNHLICLYSSGILCEKNNIKEILTCVAEGSMINMSGAHFIPCIKLHMQLNELCALRGLRASRRG